MFDMRRIYTPVIAALAAMTFLTAGAQAQTIGFKLGAAFADMSSDAATEISTERITGFSGGGHIRFGLGTRIGLQAELLSVTKGANFTGLLPTESFDYRFEYIEIPITVFVPLTTGSVAPYVFAGPAIGLEIRCRVTPRGTVTGADTERDCSDSGVGSIERRSPDISLVGGAGLGFAMGPGAVLIEGRYTAGLRAINENTAAGAGDLRHRVITVMAGYEIPLGRRW
jgi:hypothetical protein